MNISAVSTTQIVIVIAVAVMVVAGIAIGFFFVNAERKGCALSLVAPNTPGP